MATTVEPRGGSQPFLEADEYVDFQLAKTQSQIKTTEILTSVSWLALALLAYVLTFVVLDQWVMPAGFGGWGRSLWLGVLLIGGGGWLAWRILLPCFRTVHELYAAKMIESADATLKSSLLNLIDMQMHGRKSQSPLVRTSMEKRAAVELSKVDVDHAIDRHTLLRVAYSLLAMLVVCSLYVMLSPKDAFSSVQRLLLPASQTAVATRTTITNVTPEDVKVLAGEQLTVEADILGQAPSKVTLIYTTADHEFVDQPVEMQRLEEAGSSRWRGDIRGEKGRGLMQNIVYRIEAGDARTRDYNVQVLEPPSSKVETINYEFPAYTKLEPKVQPGGHIDAWEGTQVVVHATTNLPVESALLVMTDTDNPLAKGEEVKMTIRDGKRLTAAWTLDFRTDGTFARYYHIECQTVAGESDPQPTVNAIKIQPDQRPDVALLHPTQDLERPANAVIPLLVKASDPDFQLRFVTLRIEKGGEEFPSVSLLDEERQTFEGTHDLLLDKLSATGLQPGDEILYWIEARDNKQPHGNRSATPRLKIKITAPAKADEVAQQLEQDRQKQQEQAEQADPDRNPSGQEKPQPEEAADKDPRRAKPPENKPKPKPGDPQPREAEQPRDEPKAGEEPPNQPNDGPNKPDGEKKPQPGKTPSGKPEPKKNGPEKNGPEKNGPEKNGPEQPQPTEPRPGEQKPQQGDQTGEQKGGEQRGQKGTAGDKSKPGQPGDKHGNKSRQPGGTGEQTNPAERKPGPADHETALQKLIERQQQNAESNPDKAQQDPQQGNEGKEPREDKTPGDQSNPEPGKAPKPAPNKKPGAQNNDPRPAGDQPPTPPAGENKLPGEKDPAKPMPGGNKSPEKKPGTGKPNSDPQPQPQKPGQPGEKPKPGDKPMSGQESTSDPMPNESNPDQAKPSGTKPGQTKPEGTKPGDRPIPESAPERKPGQPAGKPGENKPTDKGPEGTGDNPMTDNPMTDKPMTDKPAGMKPENKPGANPPADKAAPKKPNGQAGAQPGDEKSPGQKTKGPASTPTQEQDPNNTDAPEPGQGNGQKPNTPKKAGTTPKPPETEAPEKMTGEETPAEEGPLATQKKASGKETGPATGQQRPAGEAPKAQNDLERKPDSQPGAMRKAEKPEPGSKAPKATKAKPDGSKNPEQPMPGTGKASDHPREKRPGTEATQNEPNPGPGRTNQKSQRPDSGEAGGGTPQDQGTPGSKQEGTGDTQKKAGDKTAAKKDEGGQPGDKPGPGSTKKPSESGTTENKPGEKNANGGEPSAEKPEGQPGSEPLPNEAGKPGAAGQPQPGENGDPKPGAGKPGTGKPGEAGQPGAPGKNPGQPGGKPGQGGPQAPPGTGNDNSDQAGNEAGDGPGQPQGERRNLAPAEQDQADQEAAENANEEFARKASSLVLKKLRKDLDRGEVDQQLLQELGWNKEDMERFVKRLEQQLADPGSDNSPESVAKRRQFEETLKSLGLSNKTKKRTAKGGTTTRTGEVGARKIAPPPEYQELFEEYTKELAKPTNAAGKK